MAQACGSSIDCTRPQHINGRTEPQQSNRQWIQFSSGDIKQKKKDNQLFSQRFSFSPQSVISSSAKQVFQSIYFQGAKKQIQYCVIISLLYLMGGTYRVTKSHQANFQNPKEQKNISVHSRQAMKQGLTHDKGNMHSQTMKCKRETSKIRCDSFLHTI